MRRAERSVAAGLALAALVLAGCTPAEWTQGILSGTRVAAAGLRPISWKDELEIGGTVAAMIATQNEVVGDQRATDYVNMIAQTIAAYSTRADVMPRLLIIVNEVPNAYACPGGYMFVTTGLLALCQDEAELAGVLGHEFAHVANKDGLAGVKTAQAFGVAKEEAPKVGSEGYRDFMKAYPGFANILEKVGGGIVNNAHGAKVEERADACGAEWAARAGYDPAGLGRLIERIPSGAKARWLEGLSVYKNGDTRAQAITKSLKGKKLRASGGATNAERYRSELAAVLK